MATDRFAHPRVPTHTHTHRRSVDWLNARCATDMWPWIPPTVSHQTAHVIIIIPTTSSSHCQRKVIRPRDRQINRQTSWRHDCTMTVSLRAKTRVHYSRTHWAHTHAGQPHCRASRAAARPAISDNPAHTHKQLPAIALCPRSGDVRRRRRHMPSSGNTRRRVCVCARSRIALTIGLHLCQWVWVCYEYESMCVRA